MEDNLNSESTQVKDEPGLCKTEPANRCDDLVNEFVDYTMVSVPLSATDIAEMDTTAFADSISQSTSKQVAESKQTDVAPVECMNVDENTDLPVTSQIEDQEPTNSNTCDISTVWTTTPAVEDPSANQSNGDIKVNININININRKDDDVVMLSDSEDEDKSKTAAPIEMVEKNSDKEMTQAADPAPADPADNTTETEENSADVVAAEKKDQESSVITLDDSPEHSEAEVPTQDDSSQQNSAANKGKKVLSVSCIVDVQILLFRTRETIRRGHSKRTATNRTIGGRLLPNGTRQYYESNDTTTHRFCRDVKITGTISRNGRYTKQRIDGSAGRNG